MGGNMARRLKEVGYAVTAVFDVNAHGHLYVEVLPDRAGQGFATLFVDDLDERLAGIAARGVEPTSTETYGNGVRKAIFTDPDGNEVGLGGAPQH